MLAHILSLGPVAEFAALHVMATVPNALLLERIEFDWSGRYEVVQLILKARMANSHFHSLPDWV